MHGVRVAGTIVGGLMVLGGLVWMLQGFDVAFAPKSFMTGNREWVMFGGAAVIVGTGIVAWSNRKA